ncbi:MAG: zinc-dependent dehydrogenase [Dehalococcoidales bacterium]|nr:zinc-dependent dehydrogenase [Dehalococcoidales bacterium]
MAKMPAAVFYAPQDIRLEEVDIPAIGDGEILVRVRAAGICGTDVRIMKGGKKVAAPIIIGHEMAGDVAALGAGVQGFAAGDRVTIEPVIPCGKCPLCLMGRKNICLTRPTIGYEYDGAFAKYVRIPASAIAAGNVIKLPDAISYEEAAIAEPLAAVVNGIDRCHIQLGDTVLVLGAGPIGLAHLMLSRHAGATHVYISEPNDARRQTALEFGADKVINPMTEDVVAKAKEWTGNLGVDVVIVASGVPAAMEAGMRALRKGGTFNIFAGSPPDSHFACEPNLIHYGELTVTGSSGHTAWHMRRAVDLISTGAIDAKRLITHRFQLNEIGEALGARQALTGLKHVVLMPE